MASNPPRFQRRLGVQVSPTNPDAGAAAAGIGQVLEEFSTQRTARLDEEADREGFLAGQLAGEDAEADASERTIAGRAFNRGVLVSHQAALQTDIRENVARIELENEADPEAFEAQVSGLLEGLLTESDPRLQPFIRDRAADYSGRAQTRIIGRQQEKLRTEASNDLTRGVEGLFDDATTAAFEGDVLMIETRRQELNALLDEGIAGTLVEEGAAEEFRSGFERKVTSQEVIGEFDRLVREQGTDAGAEAIKRWQDVKPSEVGLTAEDHAGVTRQLVTLRNRESALNADQSTQAAAEARADANARNGRIDDATKVLQSGRPLDRDQAAQVAEDIQIAMTTGEADDIQRATERAGDYDVASAIQEQVHRFKRLSGEQRSEEIINLESSLQKGADVDAIALLDAVKATDANIRNQLATDPRGHFQREGLIEDPPLNFESPQTLIESLGARDTEQVAQLAGEPVGKLTAAEADRFGQIYDQAEIEDRTDLLGMLTAGSGSIENAEATLAQVADKGHEQLALLGGFVMDGREQLARDIMRGQNIIAADSGVKPVRGDFQALVDETWQSAMGDAPEVRALMLDAAFSKYAELKSRTGDLSDDFNDNLFEDALEAVMPTGRFNGRKVAIPAGVTRQAFDDWTDAWTPDTFVQRDDVGEVVTSKADQDTAADPFDEVQPGDVVQMAAPGITAEKMLELVRDDGRLVELGNGRYGVSIVSAATGLGRDLTLEDGSPFVLRFPSPAQ